MTNGQHISEEDLALFAMGELDPAIASPIAGSAAPSAIEEHLPGCAPCRNALSEIAGDLALLGLSVEQQSMPAGARERFLSRIAAEPRSASIVASDAQGESRTRPFVAPVPLAVKPPFNIVPWMLAAAMFAAAAYLGSEVSHLRTLRDRAYSERDQARAETVKLAVEAARAQEVLEVLTAPAAQQVNLTEGKPAPAPTAHTSYMPSRGALVFVANNLHPLPASKAYELWIIPANGQAPLAVGTFRPDERGIASLVLPQLPVGVAAKAFGVTIERAEGSTVPTSPIILSGS